VLQEQFIHPVWKTTLEDGRLIHFKDWWMLDIPTVDIQNNHRGGWSEVGRHCCGESVFYVKRQQNHFIRYIGSGFRKMPTFKREFENIKWYQQKQIPTLDYVYFSWRIQAGNAEAILVTVALDAYSSLDELDDLAAIPQDRQQSLANAIGKSIRRMHDAGIRHCSLHPKHIFVKPDGDYWKLRFIDLETSRANLGLRTYKIRDLETLARRSKQEQTDFMQHILMSYLGKKSIDGEVSWWQEKIRRRTRKKLK